MHSRFSTFILILTLSFTLATPTYASTFDVSSFITIYNKILSLLHNNISSQVGQVVASNSGMIAHWTFDEGSGTTAQDASGNGNTGTLTNGTAWTSGKVGSGAVSFDGNDLVTVPHSNAFNSSEITISFWVNPSVVKTQRLIEKTEWIVRFDNGKLEMVKGIFFGAGAIPTNQWTHAVFTGDGSHYRWYINGTLVKETAQTWTVPTGNNSIRIGGAIDPFIGQLDDVRIYNHALSSDEVSALYGQTENPQSNNEASVTSTPTPTPTPDTSLSLSNTYFVRKGANGNGTSWNNAWGDMGAINWSLIKPGTTICIAGGVYEQTLTPKVSGMLSDEILIKRAVSSDPHCGSQTVGWNGNFDSQVVIQASPFGVYFNVSGLSYITIDGSVDNGIKIIVPNLKGNVYGVGVKFGRGTHDIKLTHIDFSGPDTPGNIVSTGDNRCIDTNAWTGYVSERHTRITISNNRIHGCINLIYLANASDTLIERNMFYDAIAPAPSHTNVVISFGTSNIIFRYNEIYNWNTEGILLNPTKSAEGFCGVWYIYGNAWHDGVSRGIVSGGDRVLESQYPGQGPIYFYNNTVANVWLGINPSTWNSNSQNKNNIFWNIYAMHANNAIGRVFSAGLPNGDYNLSDLQLDGAHDIFSKNNPFLNSAAQDYKLSLNSPAKDKGVMLASDSYLNKDINGTIRGADGLWDIGAYEYESTGASVPPVQQPTLPPVSTPVQTPVVTGSISTGGAAGSGAGSSTKGGNSSLTVPSLPYVPSSSMGGFSTNETLALNGSIGVPYQNPIYHFTRNLKLGSRGNDVLELQKYLNTHGFTVATQGSGSPGNETTYFGPATYKAVVKFQEANRIAILAPYKLTKGTGFVGPATLKVLNTSIHILPQTTIPSSNDVNALIQYIKQLMQQS